MSQQDNSRDLILASGQYLTLMRTTSGWEYARHNRGYGAVAAVGWTDDNRIVLVKQYRPPVRRVVLELPSGVAETPDLSYEAAREFAEETPYELVEIKHLYSAPICAGLSSGLLHVFWGIASIRKLDGGVSQSAEIISAEPYNMDGLMSGVRSSGDPLVDQTVYAALAHLNRVHGGRGKR